MKYSVFCAVALCAAVSSSAADLVVGAGEILNLTSDVAEAFDGGDIRIGSGYCPRYLNSTSCSLVIDGQGHDVVNIRGPDHKNQLNVKGILS